MMLRRERGGPGGLPAPGVMMERTRLLPRGRRGDAREDSAFAYLLRFFDHIVTASLVPRPSTTRGARGYSEIRLPSPSLPQAHASSA